MSTTFVAYAKDEPQLHSLRALAHLLGLHHNGAFKTVAEEVEEITLVKTTKVSDKCFWSSGAADGDAATTVEEVSKKVSYTGILDSAKALTEAAGCYQQCFISGNNVGVVEECIQEAMKMLMPIAYHGQAVDAADAIETYLSSNNAVSTPFLCGATATAADIIVAVLLSDAVKASSSLKLGESTTAWMERVRALPGMDVFVGTADAASSDEVAKGVDNIVLEDNSALFADNPIVIKLKELGIPHSTYGHELCVTAEELVAKVPLASPETESHTKNLLFKDKKHGMFLITAKTDSPINTKSLGKALGLTGKVNLRLTDETTLQATLGVAKGCVGPLSTVNDTEGVVTLVLDQALLNLEKIHSHPMYNNVSTSMTPDALMEYLTKVNHEPKVVDFAAIAAEGGGDAGKKDAAAPKGAAKAQQPSGKQEKKSTKKGETLLALQWKKEENFPAWYSDVIVLSEMIAYYDISGCYILRPWSYKIWELMQDWFNPKIRELGVENCYFPLFVSQDRLEKEKDHVEGFAPEVAWVTKSGDGTLAKPIAVRPTSETIMYPAFSDWIQSHRDLPLKLNQWSNVVRWEFKDPTPFLRSREFLWQEGHTAHATIEDANEMVMQALDLYRGVYEDLLAVPVIKGFKTEKEKFAGGYQTTTVEAYIPLSGRAIQGATSHNLGQNFGKMFDITYQNDKGESEVVWQTSWGLTTRTIGVMIMVHGDDKGLVLPPRVAPVQAVIVPIISKNLAMDVAAPYCDKIVEALRGEGIRTKFDDRTMYNPGWKYNHWEQKGVPIRIEVGPRDIENNQARVVVRYNGEKVDLPVNDGNFATTLKEKLVTIHDAMFSKAKTVRDDHLVQITEWKDFVPNLELNNLVLTPWCGGEHTDWEEWVKEKSREESLRVRGEGEEDARAATSVAAKTLCIPFKQPELPEGTKCFASGLPATCWILWGRSY